MFNLTTETEVSFFSLILKYKQDILIVFLYKKQPFIIKPTFVTLLYPSLSILLYILFY